MQIEAKLKNLNLDIVGQLVQVPLEFWQAGYHKDEEFEADREGVRLAVASGYSPYGAVDIFTRLSKLCDEYVIHAKGPGEELSELAIQSLTGYFRSHPAPSERLAQIQRLIAEEHWEDKKMQRPFHLEYEVHNGQYVK
jgi:beta-barrel assembly-enhancing protease